MKNKPSYSLVQSSGPDGARVILLKRPDPLTVVSVTSIYFPSEKEAALFTEAVKAKRVKVEAL